MRILIVEDEPNIAAAIHNELHASGFGGEVALTGSAALDRLAVSIYDLVILDLMLPDGDGLDVCREIRARGGTMPILILSARHRVDDRVRGLDAGADDYLTKPFVFGELQARIRALLRRPGAISLAPLTVADLRIDPLTRHVTRGGRRIDLSAREFALLDFLMRNAGHPVTRGMIAEHVWGLTWDPLTNVIDVFVNHVRKKIEASGESRLIQAVRGVGYLIRSPD